VCVGKYIPTYRRKVLPPYVGVENGADSLQILVLRTKVHYRISQSTQRSCMHLFREKGKDEDKHFLVQVMKAHWGVWLSPNHS